ncbi:MAG: rubredoxin [Desulfuromonas sp.]|nr:rubredoxin [Desulfuromonas sp.]
MANFQCGLCSYLYDDGKEEVLWGDLPEDWTCSVCGSGKDLWQPFCRRLP